MVIAEDFDLEGNTLGHISARSGNSNLFKVMFTLMIHILHKINEHTGSLPSTKATKSLQDT